MKKQLAACVAVLVLLIACFGAPAAAYGQKLTASDLNLSGNGVVVLNYHLVLDEVKDAKRIKALSGNPQLTTYNVFLKDFKEQIASLKRQGVVFITPEQLRAYMVHGKSLPAQKCVLLTFDDVDVSVYKNVYPVLKRERIPFTAFVITGQAGNPNYKGLDLADWREIREMQSSGFASIGVHTYNMHYLDSSTNQPPFLNESSLQAFKLDMKRSILTYWLNLGYKPTLFAYPYGYGTPATDEALMSAGFNMLFSLRPGVVQPEPQDRPFFIKRVLLTYDAWSGVEEWATSK